MGGYGRSLYASIQSDFEKIINDFRKKNFVETQKALEVAAAEMAKRLSNASPIGARGGTFKQGWSLKSYANVKYIYNKEGVRGVGLGIPLSNLFEYSRRLSPFIGITWEKNKQDIERLFIREIKKNLRRN